MEKRMGTLTDDKDGKVSPDPLHPPEHDTETMDEDRTPDTETPYGNCPTRCTADKNSYTVKGSENSTIRDSTVIGVLNKTVIKNEKQQEGVTCNVTAEGAKPRVKISVPAEDGGTVIHVDSTNGELRYLSYYRKVKNIENTFGSTWTFRNIFADFMALIFNGGKSDDFFDLFEKLKERYGCEVHKVFQKCLVIEFLHETAEGRDRMIKEKETVKQMFQTFIEGIKPNAPSCTLEVSTEKNTSISSDKPETELKHVEQDVRVPSTSKSEQAQAQRMLPREYKKDERFQSVSDDESERPLSKKMKYLDESEELAEFQNQTEASHPGIIDLPGAISVTFGSSRYASSAGASVLASEPLRKSRGARRSASEPPWIRDRIRQSPWMSQPPTRSRVTQSMMVSPARQRRGAPELPRKSRDRGVSRTAHLGQRRGAPELPRKSRDRGVSRTAHLGKQIEVSRKRPDETETSSSIDVRKSRDVEREPIPVSQVHLHNCGRCSEVLQNCENELSALPNLHFIHFNPNFRKTSKLQFTKILSALRNSGGVLLVHHHYPAGSGLDSLNRFINQISDSVLTRDVVTCVTCEVFKTQRIRNYEDMFRIDVQPSEMYVTHDYKTKFPSLSTGEFENASNERIRHLLFSSRTTESTEAALKGISSRQQNVEDLRLRYTRPIPMLSGPSEPPRHMLNVLVDDIDVDDIMTSHSVPEHITSLSKKKSGGSMFVVMAGLTFDDTPLCQQERFKARLMQTLKKNLRVQKNKHSKVSLQDIDVFKVGLSKDADSGDCILEIAVGHVNGCVFYDSQGPESYKIEGEKIVRLPIERWVEEAFE